MTVDVSINVDVDVSINVNVDVIVNVIVNEIGVTPGRGPCVVYPADPGTARYDGPEPTGSHRR